MTLSIKDYTNISCWSTPISRDKVNTHLTYRFVILSTMGIICSLNAFPGAKLEELQGRNKQKCSDNIL